MEWGLVGLPTAVGNKDEDWATRAGILLGGGGGGEGSDHGSGRHRSNRDVQWGGEE